MKKNTQDPQPAPEPTPKEGADLSAMYPMTGEAIFERGYESGYNSAVVAFVKGMLIATVLYCGVRLITTSE